MTLRSWTAPPWPSSARPDPAPSRRVGTTTTRNRESVSAFFRGMENLLVVNRHLRSHESSRGILLPEQRRVDGSRCSATRRRSGREARGAGTSGGGGGRGARVPRRERASGQQALVWRGHGSDDDCGGHCVPRQVSVRGADAGRRQQNDVVVVAVVPEAGDPAGIGRTGIGEGREQHHRAHEYENQRTLERHWRRDSTALLRLSSNRAACLPRTLLTVLM